MPEFSAFVAFKSILKTNNLYKVKSAVAHMYKNTNDCD